MAVNKVIVGTEVKLDLTADTVSEDNLLAGATAHNAAGEPIEGAVVTVPVDSELSEESANAIQNMAVAKAVNVLKSDLGNLESYFEPGFNLYDGSYNENKVWKNANCVIADKEGYWCTNLIPVDDTKGLRIRVKSNERPYKVLAYDENLNVYLGETGTSTYAISITGMKYISVSFYNSVNPNEVMIAYTDETSNGSIDMWENLFPGIGYIPYTHYINEENLHIKSIEIFQKELNNNEEYKTADLLNDVKEIGGISIENDVDGLQMVHFSGVSYTKSWFSVYKECQPNKVALLEFTGKSSNVEASDSTGSMMIIEFFDKENNIIGSKYNSFVLGENRCGFHRYGAVSPSGCTKVGLRFATRSNTDMYIKNISFRVIDAYPMNEGNRVHGHLGMIFVSPKNTLPSFELAKMAGFNTVVTNVNVTKDNVLVALHDSTIDATSNGTGNVSDFTYEQLLQYDFGSWFSTYYTGTKIPKFEEVIKFFAVSGIRPALSLHGQLNNDRLDDVCNILMKYGFSKRCLVKSFSLSTLDYMYNKLGEGKELEYLYDNNVTTSVIDDIVSNHNYLTGVELTGGGITSEIVDYAKSNGLEVSMYFGNDMQFVRKCVKIGITRFCVDTFSDIVFPID